jgi:hypothetical protein
MIHNKIEHIKELLIDKERHEKEKEKYEKELEVFKKKYQKELIIDEL